MIVAPSKNHGKPTDARSAVRLILAPHYALLFQVVRPLQERFTLHQTPMRRECSIFRIFVDMRTSRRPASGPVVAASASLPVIIPPMMVAVEAIGKRFEEMHVVGGVTAPVLTLPEAFLLRDANLGPAGDLDLYILINNKVDRNLQVVPNTTIEIASRSSSTMTKLQTRSILYNTYGFARRNHYGYHLTYIERDQPSAPTSGFDTAYIRDLFEYGYERGRGAGLSSRSPPADETPASATLGPL